MKDDDSTSRGGRRLIWLLPAIVLLLAGDAALFYARSRAVPAYGFIEALAFSPDGRQVVTVGIRGNRLKPEGEAKVWDSATGRVLSVISGYSRFVYSVAFASDGKTLAFGGAKTGEFGEATLWDLPSGKPRLAIPAQHESVSALAFSPDGTLLATGGLDGVAKLSQCADGRQHALLLGHTSIVSSVSFSADGTLLATGSWDKTVRLWRVRDGRVIRVIRLPWAVLSVALAPDGLTLVAAGKDPSALVFDTITGAAWGPPLAGHQGAVNAVAYSSDGLLMVSGGTDNTVRLWSVPTHQCVATYTGHTKSVSTVAFSPDHHRVVSAGKDNTLRFWEVKPEK